MSKIIECIVDTKDKKEREELINYVSQMYVNHKELFVSVIDDYDGFALVGIRQEGNFIYLGVICAKDLTENHNLKHFLSVKEFINYHEKKSIARYTLTMPDGFWISVHIYEGESEREKINSFIDKWYKDSNEDPKKFNHFDIKDKCPKCGGPMRCKIVGDQAKIWCLDRNCGYRDTEKNPKARERVYEKFGLKTEYVHKTGCTVIFSNKPIKK